MHSSFLIQYINIYNYIIYSISRPISKFLFIRYSYSGNSHVYRPTHVRQMQTFSIHPAMKSTDACQWGKSCRIWCNNSFVNFLLHLPIKNYEISLSLHDSQIYVTVRGKKNLKHRSLQKHCQRWIGEITLIHFFLLIL